jgi:hypothetical protein
VFAHGIGKPRLIQAIKEMESPCQEAALLLLYKVGSERITAKKKLVKLSKFRG